MATHMIDPRITSYDQVLDSQQAATAQYRARHETPEERAKREQEYRDLMQATGGAKMRITKNGDPNQAIGWWWHKSVTCEACDCEFVLEEGDPVKLQRSGRWQGVNVECPYCKHPFRVENGLPTGTS